MKLTLFESSGQVHKQMSMEEGQEILQTKCRQNWEALKSTKRFIFRGDDTELGTYSVATPGTSVPHGAQHTDSNLHYNILNMLPEWKDVPNRTQSIDMATSYQYAMNYGDVYVCVPFDGTKVAFAKDIQDFWDIVRPEEFSIDDSMYGVRKRDRALAVERGGIFAGKEIDDLYRGPFSKLLPPDETRKQIEKWNELVGTDDSAMNKFVQLLKTSRKKVTVTADMTVIPKGVEVWSEGPVLLMHKQTLFP